MSSMTWKAFICMISLAVSRITTVIFFCAVQLDGITAIVQILGLFNIGIGPLCFILCTVSGHSHPQRSSVGVECGILACAYRHDV
ncbi:hypothetical protein DSUL_50088 [Desulfovibrionales bacterium]